MAVKTSWSSGDVLTAADLTDTFAAKADISAAGKILQVLQAVKTDSSSGTNTTFSDLSGMSVSITPASATSKILVRFSIPIGYSNSANFALVNLVRDSTNIAQSTGGALANQTQVIFTTHVGSTLYAAEYLDSPNTTSATTYKLQIRAFTSGETWYANRYSTNSNYGSIGSITVMEVGA